MFDTTNRRYDCMLYSMTNAADENEIIAFRRETNGYLDYFDMYKTGGEGTGAQTVDPLMSQGAIVLSDNGRFLFTVNAGSGSISCFKITGSGALILTDVKYSDGFFPISIAVHRNLLYVVNRGNGSNIPSNLAGFWVDENGKLTEIPNAVKPLSSRIAQPTCIIFSYESRKIVISEVNTNLISVFIIQPDGSLSGPVVSPSSGAGPFGSVFLTNRIFLITESGANALSSYTVNNDGTLSVISSSVPNNQTAACWVSLSNNKRFAYTSNAGGHTITTYNIEYDGQLRVSDIIYSTKEGTGAPIDSGICSDYLYVLNGNEGSVSDFTIVRDGRLIRTHVSKDMHLPILGSQGLAVLYLPSNSRY